MFLALLALAAVLLASGAGAQTMYKCVDARGVTHYTDKPQPGCKGREVEIQGQPPISGRLTPQRDSLQRDERDFQRRRIAGEQGREAELRSLEAQKRRCAGMQAELQRLESGVRLRRTDATTGERSYVDDEERARRAAPLREEIARKCP